MLHVTLHGATGLRAADKSGFSDPTATLSFGAHPKPKKTLFKSRILKQTLNPKWNEQYAVHGDFDELCRGPMRVAVFDDDSDEHAGKYDRLGEGAVNLRRHPFIHGLPVSLSVSLDDGQRRNAAVHVTMRWEPSNRFSPTDGILHVALRQAALPGMDAAAPFTTLRLAEQTLRSEPVVLKDGNVNPM